jgi:hypothetical protein
MRVTPEEAAILIDRFTSYIASMVDEDVTVRHSTDGFHVEVLRKKRRVAHPTPPPPELYQPDPTSRLRG